MTIAAITRNHTGKDLAGYFKEVEWIELKDVPAPGEYPQVELYLDLDFTNEERRKNALARLLPALVFVNAVVPTLGEIGHPFVRINGWPGFRVQQMHELVVPDEATALRVDELYTGLGCSYRPVPDTPGMIAPRILAGIINEAWYTWEEKVSSKEEIDIAMKLGTNYPLGPFEWGDRIGLEQVTGLLWSLSKGDRRYTPARALQAASGLKCD
jgi:3-hydroxybutyryl-CoA dehydrogenase